MPFLIFLIYVSFSLTLPQMLINKFAFVVMFLILLLLGPVSKIKIQSFSPALILTFFIYAFLISTNFVPDEGLRIQLMLSVASLFLIYFIRLFDIDVDKISVLSGVFLSLSTFLMAYSFLESNFLLYNIFEKYGSLGVGARDVGNGTQDFFRLGGAPFLFVSFSVLVKKIFDKINIVNIVLLIIIVVAMLLSSARSLIVASLLIVFWLIIQRIKHLVIVLFPVLLAASIMGIILFVDFSGTMFDVNDAGNSHKVQHAISFFNWLDFNRFIFGEGLASQYFSSAVERFTPQTEITILDNVRYFGFPLTVAFYLALVFPSIKICPWKVEDGYPLAVFSVYLLMSVTNPMLINSYGFIVVLWYWGHILKERKEGL